MRTTPITDPSPLPVSQSPPLRVSPSPPLRASPPKRGRPLVFDELKQNHFCSLLRLGCTISQAAASVGISRRAVLYAANRDPQLAERIRLARLASRLSPIQRIQRASEKSWRAAAWLLERSSRDWRLPRRSAQAATKRKKMRVVNSEYGCASAPFPHPASQPTTTIDRILTEQEKKSLHDLALQIKSRRDRGEPVDLAAELRRHFRNGFTRNGK